MAGEAQRRSIWFATISLFSVVLIFLGLAFLIHNFKLAPSGFWGILWRFWPVLFMLIGLNILLGSARSVLMVVITALAMLGVLGLSLYISWIKAGEKPTITTIFEPQGVVQRAKVTIDFGAGILRIDGAAGQSGNLVEGTAEHRGQGNGVKKEYNQSGGVGNLKLSVTSEARQLLGEKRDKWQLHFSRDIPLDINLKSGLSDLVLDLSLIKAENLNLDIGASTLVLNLPVSWTSKVMIKSGIATINIIIPQGKAARIKAEGGFSSSDIDQNRFPLLEGYYVSPDFNSNPNRVDLEIRSSLSRVKIK